MNTKPVLGVLGIHAPGNPPFAEQGFFKELAQTGEQEGIPVLVFLPDEVDFSTLTVKGYRLDQSGHWRLVKSRVPPYIYDRCFYTGRNYNIRYKPSILKLQAIENVCFLGIGLKGKWQMYQAVSTHPILSGYLPPTDMVSGMSQIKQWLNQYPAVILKPIDGSLGIGVMKVSKNEQGKIKVEGRDKSNQPIVQTLASISELFDFIHPWIQKWKYLIQPYLKLRTKEGNPFDLRLFMQKDGTGNWTTVGKAIRLGRKNSITSNLHGGGVAQPAGKFLSEHYPREMLETITSRIAEIESSFPPFMEERHGPLVELGLDIGIDLEGKVWLIEVNSKPGRKIFTQLKDKEGWRKSRTNPLFYTKYLIQSRIGG